jgi:hypothetical protein
LIELEYKAAQAEAEAEAEYDDKKSSGGRSKPRDFKQERA